MNDNIKNECIRCALSTIGKEESEREKLLAHIMGIKYQSRDILREMDGIIQFVEMHLAYLYNKCIMRMPSALSPDRYEKYHTLVDHWIKEEYPWMDESSKTSLVGKLSYR